MSFFLRKGKVFSVFLRAKQMEVPKIKTYAHTKSQAPHSHLPYGEQGVGMYGKNRSKQPWANLKILQGTIMEAVDTIPLPTEEGNQLFTIGDYGCADGSCSISLIGDIIRRVRERAQRSLPVQVIYEDQPTSDYNSLFRRIHGLIPEPRSYLQDFDEGEVYVLASGTSFFRPVLPPNTADLVLSFESAHYLSEPGPTYQDSLHRFPNASPEECKIVEAQAAKEWETFLLQRARELKKGGVLFVTVAAYDPQGLLHGLKHIFADLEEALLNCWRGMRDQGLITQEEFVNTNMHRCARTTEELSRPFVARDSPVRLQGLELVSADLVHAPCTITAEWKHKLDNEGIDHGEEWSQAVLQSHRIWCNSPFLGALSPARTPADKEALVDQLFNLVHEEIKRKGPRAFRNDHLVAFLLARKC